IFIILFSLFIITCLTHMITFFKIKSIRNYVKQTKRLDINPLHSIKSEFESRQHTETITLETFIQEKFSDWRILQIPAVNIIKLVQMTNSVSILLEVLCTFIGMTISQSSISANNHQSIAHISAILS